MATQLDIFDAKTDKYKGVSVDTSKLDMSTADFDRMLKDSLSIWSGSGIRGVWFKVPLIQASFVPLLSAQGFEYHHAKSSYVMMTKWLVEEANALPSFPHTHIGVAGFVVNDKNQVLVIKEKYHVKKHWKFPGGYSNPGEDFATTAKREVLEETGIRTEFQSILAFRHYHEHQFDCSDIYVVCYLKPLNLNIQPCADEIEECKWMKIEDLKNHPEVAKMNLLVLETFLENRDKNIGIGITPYFSEFSNSMQKIYHIKNNTE